MNLNEFAYKLGVLGTVIILLWVGLFKFTAVEAGAIKELVENHFAMGWMYKVMSLQMVSNVIGFSEIIIGIGLFASLFYNKIGLYAGFIFGFIGFFSSNTKEMIKSISEAVIIMLLNLFLY